MNQILYTGGKNGKKGMTDIQKIIIFFIVFLIIFAICLIGVGANLFSKVKNGNEAGASGQPGVSNTVPDEPVEPKIEIKFESQLGGVRVTVTSDKIIDNITYCWDEEAPTTLEPNDTKYETTIPSKQGTHTLKIEVTDEDGNMKTASQLVIGDAEPELTLLTDGVSNYVIRAKDDEEIDRLVIVLNGETEEVEVNAKEIEYKVPIPQGDSLIEVTAYNLNEISITKKGKITNFGG